MLKKWRLASRLEAVRRGRIPAHVAIIMDGNGRWAKRRGLPRVAGHRAGMQAIKRCLTGLRDLDVKYLTLYAFSTENWNRPKTEVDFLMDLPRQFIDKELNSLIDNNIRLGVIGDVEGLPDHTREAILNGMAKTQHNSGLQLNFALNYGAREEIIGAVRQLAVLTQNRQLNPKDITGEMFEDYLYTQGIPGPDLVIRTSGEIRISNFLLWQIAYAELCFMDTLWPDFNEFNLYSAIEQFQKRNRRFGGI